MPEADPGLVTGNLKPKPGRVLLNDLAAALALPRDAVCRETTDEGSIDCLEAHRVALGEVAPREQRIYTPVQGLVTGVIAFERVALHACRNRVIRDGEGDDGLVPEVRRGLGRPARRDRVVRRMTERLVRREATEAEREALVGLYDTLLADGIDDVDTQWAIATCFALATLTENRFY